MPRWRSRSTSPATRSRPTGCWPPSKSGSRRGSGKQDDAKSRRHDAASIHSAERRRRQAADRPFTSSKTMCWCGVDDRAEAEAMLKRFAGNATDNLKSVAAYKATMERCRREAGSLEPEARWFVEPFGFIFAARTLRQERPPHERPGHRQDPLRERLRRDPRRRRLLQSIGRRRTSSSSTARAIYAPPVRARRTIRCGGT